MKPQPRFNLHPGAAQDITEIWEYIADSSLSAAGRLRAEVFSIIGGLTTFPQQGHKRSDLTNRPLRFRTAREYLIAYAPDENPLVVIAVLHGRRSPRIIANILRERQ